MYKRVGKRAIDVTLSLLGLILASWLYLLIMIAIEIDDPGPVFFSQKRVGIHKKYFQLYKFRSMKMSTPHDMPTHLLENPEQYITRVGKFLRKTSLDEIPQLWNILRGDMSVIGPRPALWNQEDLLAERDKYGANDVKPGLSGWAQICGRDELEIADKARLDGEYVRRMSFAFDCRCFFGTVISALRGDGGGEGLERTHALLSGPFAVQGQSAECRLNGKAETADLDEIQFQGKVNAHAAQQRNQAVHSPQKSIDFGHDFGQLFHHGTHSPANRRLRRRDRTRPPPASAASRTEKTLLLF